MPAEVSLRWIVKRRMPRSSGGQQGKNPAWQGFNLYRTLRFGDTPSKVVFL